MKIKNNSFEPLNDSDGWYVFGDGSDDPESAEQQALALQKESLDKGYYCVCGVVGDEGYGLYLVPQKGIRYVIETFEVGSHGGAEPESVFAEIELADAENPLIPYFADKAGIKAKFTKPVTKELLAILEESMSSIEAMMDPEEGSIDGYIREHNGIHLWWD
jgi:hypothetical protein